MGEQSMTQPLTSELVERLNYCHEFGIFDAAEAGKMASYAEAAAEIIRLQAEVERKNEALRTARDAIASADTEAFGMVVVQPRGEDDFGHEYPVRDELLATVSAALGDDV